MSSTFPSPLAMSGIIDMAYFDKIKEARLALGLTQDQVAQQIGVAKSTFTGYEKGIREPNMLTLSKIMKVLHVDANYLFQDESPSSPSPLPLIRNDFVTIGERLKARREALGLTLEQVGDYIGVGRATVQRYENNSIDIKRTIAIKLSEILKTTPSYIMGWEDTPSSANVSPAPADLDENIKKYLLLNAEGKKKAGERIDELLELPKYRNSTPAPRNVHTEEQIAAAIKQITEDSPDVGSLLFNLSRSKK